MKNTSIALLLGTCLLASASHAADCVGLYKQVADKAGATVMDKIKMVASDLFSSSCGSAFTVASQTLGRNKSAHLRLEDKKAFDPAQGQANLDEALKDPAVQEQLQDARPQIADEDLWQLYQASVFDAEGYYDARDFVVRQLQQKLGLPSS
jgi:hypothetical protein